MSSDLKFGAIAGFRLVTADLTRLAAFYRAIGFDIGDPMPISTAEMALLGISGTGMRIEMSLGTSRVDLDCYALSGRPYPTERSASDRIFQHFALVTDDAHMAWNRARDAGATPISRERPVTLPQSSGGVTAVKLRDPEGHPLEFTQFPRGANPDWRGSGILGIDHSAIAVRDLAASRRFYSHHGMVEGEPMLNQGPTQVVLDGIDGIVVDIVPMQPATAPPHIELLGYRDRVSDTGQLAVNDIAATRIVWRSAHDALMRDPDGHFHQFSRADRLRTETLSR
ncbi:VOC family protein [Massilia sp. 9096]|uniref:VOC family protein n=1 Tax=Massilia sp. 9096 TaxID=1500894 RepID=UPI00068C2285|nr:VOC family protein [Massilia sp. 9096]